MKHVFEKAMTFVAKWEWTNRMDGHLTEDPHDPGGVTKFGISQRAHPELDVRALTLPDAMQVYWSQYWVPIGGDGLPWDLAIAAFDTAVNVGVRRTRKWLETHQTRQALLERRTAYYLSLNNPRFEKGWLNRVNDLKKYLDILEQAEE
jgi:lysozyme family protein